jgi:hypothetical protein
MRNALDHLLLGDAVQQRIRLDRTTAAQVADDLGISGPLASKANWLATAYPPAARSRIGLSVLRELGVSHLEAVALVSEPKRSELLKRAAREGLAVRTLKQLSSEHERSTRTPEPTSVGAPQLVRAAETYLGFDDAQLRRLLEGPNGSVVKRFARSGADLAARIAEHER